MHLLFNQKNKLINLKVTNMRLFRFILHSFFALSFNFIFFDSAMADLDDHKYSLSMVTFPPSAQEVIKVVFTFSQSAPKVSFINNESNSPSIAFASTTYLDSVKTSYQLSGNLHSLDLKQSNQILIVNFHTLGKVRLAMDTLGQNAISISLINLLPANDSSTQNNTESLRTQSTLVVNQNGFEVVHLKYADVSEIVGVLAPGNTIKANDNFIKHEPGFGSAALGLQPNQTIQEMPEPANQPLAQTINEIISVDRRLNAIILRGPHDLIADYKQKISQLDIKVASVILETIFVELSESGAKNLGIDFTNANGQITLASYATGAYLPAGATSGYLKSSELQAAIYAQVQAGKGRIVSKPRISAQSGLSAKIITGNEIPIQTSILSGINNVVSTQVQYVNVGVTLQIAPRVSEDGYVSSHVFCEVSSVTGASSAGYPTVSQRSAETSATVFDGETFVIGGLTQEAVTDLNTKVPLIGDIPLIGKFFQKDAASSEKTNLYIVVTPHIIKRSEDVGAINSD
jgi:general secretion pathway protein D